MYVYDYFSFSIYPPWKDQSVSCWCWQGGTVEWGVRPSLRRKELTARWVCPFSPAVSDAIISLIPQLCLLPDQAAEADAGSHRWRSQRDSHRKLQTNPPTHQEREKKNPCFSFYFSSCWHFPPPGCDFLTMIFSFPFRRTLRCCAVYYTKA